MAWLFMDVDSCVSGAAIVPGTGKGSACGGRGINETAQTRKGKEKRWFNCGSVFWGGVGVVEGVTIDFVMD